VARKKRMPQMAHPEFRESQKLKVPHHRFQFIGKAKNQIASKLNAINLFVHFADNH